MVQYANVIGRDRYQCDGDTARVGARRQNKRCIRYSERKIHTFNCFSLPFVIGIVFAHPGMNGQKKSN